MRGGAGRVAIASSVAIAFALAGTTVASASGNWTVVQGTVGTSSGISGGLDAIACPDSTCWAVGGISPASPTDPDPALIETNSGSGWSVVTAPTTTPGWSSVLNGIACADADDCWAVGATGDETLIAEYAGGTWTTVASPSPPEESEPELFGVSCVSNDDCWAVGWDRDPGAAEQTLIEHYDGTGWSIVSSPNTNDGGANLLNGVACANAAECWAVGGGTLGTPLIEQYNGTAWAIDTNVDAPGQASDLQAVTCTGPDACWAVGTTGPTSGSESQTLIERYDGTAWERVPSPSPNPFPGSNFGEDYLYGVTCDTGNECWAVGHTDYFQGADYGWSLIERYTASTGWTLDGFDPALPAELFYAVGCGALECAAVGTEVESEQPLIAQSPVTMASVGGSGGGSGSHGTSGSPPSGSTASSGDAGPGVPDTGSAGAPWAPLLIGSGIATVALAVRIRSRRPSRRR
jgi:hypothetical protein